MGSATSGRGSAGSLRWWDIGVVATLLVMAVLAWFLAQDGSPAWAVAEPIGTRLAWMLVPLAVFGLVYVLLGRSALRGAIRDDPIPGRVVWALLALILVMGCAVFVQPLYALLQALVYPMVWTLVSRYSDAVLWSAVVALAVGLSMFAGLAITNFASGLFSALFSGPLSFAFAVFMGTWITRVWDQGERHRKTAEQLRASQAEVATLSEAAGAASERERLSRDLHDTLTQTLTGLVMLSEQAERALAAEDRSKAEDRLARVGEAAREALVEARALVATTQPLAAGGLVASIERVAGRLRADTGLRVDCRLEAVPLDREREVVLLRAAQEGLANARRHAQAESVSVVLALLPGSPVVASLVVEDDGIGPTRAKDAAAVGGFGLSGLTERVRAVGGSVSFGPAEGGGARLEVLVPGEENAS